MPVGDSWMSYSLIFVVRQLCSMEHVCKNCGNSFNGKFCNSCGQKFDVPQFTYKHIFEEGFHAFTHADKSFLAFIKKILISPGRVAYEYIIERKRKKYFNPFTFFLLVTAINAFMEGAELHLKEKLFHYNNEYGQIFNIYSKVLSLICIPLVALAFWLVHFKKPRFLYSEYTVFAMMLLSMFSLVEIFSHAVNYSVTALAHSSFSLGGNLIYLIISVAYLAFADYQFHVKAGKSSIIKSILCAVLFFAVMFAIEVFIIWGVINGFQGIGSFSMYGIRFN